MNTTTKYLATGITGLALAVFVSLVVAFPASALTVGGCAMTDHGGYSTKADPTCQFNFDSSDNRDGPAPIPADWQEIIDDILNGEDA